MTTLIRLPEVIRRTGLSRSGIYAAIAQGTFPAQIPLSGPAGRAIGFDSDAVNYWINARIADAEAHASMSIAKAAEEVGIPPEELQPFIDSDKLPTFRVGRHRLVKKTALAAFRKEHAETDRAPQKQNI